MQDHEIIDEILSSPFVDGSLWLDGLGGDRRDRTAAGLYLSLPISARPKISHLFDAEYYRETNPDVHNAGVDLFIHFIEYGCQENRSPHPLVSIPYIRSRDSLILPEFPSTQELYDVLHFDLVDPSPYFSNEYYRSQVDGGSDGVVGSLEDFIKSGLLRGIKPNPFWDPLWYYRQLTGAHDVWSGLRHFVMQGDKQGYAPSHDFSAKRYVQRYPDVSAAGTPILMHYLVIGRAEGRQHFAEQNAAPLMANGPSTSTAAAIDETESAWLYQACKERISKRRQEHKDSVFVAPRKILKLRDPLRQVDKLAFPRFVNPKVSILVPVYNEMTYTMECLTSILNSNPTLSYEVVIADDASTDESVGELSQCRNTKYVRQPANVGFLANCNAAFQSCEGQYILLLNNDAQLLPGALDALVNVLERETDVAAVGPKMLYPNGRLQEAGCVIDRNGVSKMVGLFANPHEPAFNFARDVHYCSGAALLVRRSELGDTLFDEAFSPAYCEDADLCLRLLSRGRRIVYCPEAEIVHHLSVSTNKQSVTRRLQLVAKNQQKLARKWPTLLEELNRVRAIAFYLPQYHTTEENDFNWGMGFTEWSNVIRADPAYVGHYQPHLPADLGFYDLRVRQTIERQTALARRYGIAGFCVYYYNFGDRRALDKAFEAVVSDRSIDFPYCVCWANENWTRHWDGGNQELIFEQMYDNDSLLNVIRDATRYAADPRYLRVNGRPLFLVYRPLLLPDIPSFAAMCRQGFCEAGFDGVHLVYVESMEAIQRLPRPNDLGFDASVEFPPQGLAVPAPDPPIPVRQNFVGACYDYELTILENVSRASVSYKRYPTVFPSWDNTPRQPMRGDSFIGSSPEAFQVFVEEKLEEVTSMFVGDERLLFINAWNEWAEGTHLEPDQKYGHRWLEAIRNALLAKSLA